jgi:hypothetical protein
VCVLKRRAPLSLSCEVDAGEKYIVDEKSIVFGSVRFAFKPNIRDTVVNGTKV